MAYRRTAQGIIGTLTIAICFQLYSLYNLEAEMRHYMRKGYATLPPCDIPHRPTVVVKMSKRGKPDSVPSPVVQMTMRAFARLGYVVHTSNPLASNEPWLESCDFIWSHGFPFRDDVILGIFANETNNAKINHFPGIGWIGNKLNFNTQWGGSKYTPKTYLMPRDKKDLLEKITETRNDSTMHWAVKGSHHRDVSVKASHELAVDHINGLIQQFIRNQFLLHGHVISLGIMVVITSVSPLRVYIHDNGWMVRIAGKPYQPGNYSDTETFISNGGSNNLFEFEPMEKFFKIGYSRSQALFAHMTSELGVPQSKIDFINKQTRMAVLDAVVERRHLLMRLPETKNMGTSSILSNTLGTYSSFFEVMRWDFVIDEDMKVYLLEANMSPNMVSDNPTILAKNYNLLLSTLSALGYRYGSKHTNGLFFTRIRDADINVDLQVCFTEKCESCMHEDCILCLRCLSREEIKMLRASLIAHINRLQLRNAYGKRSQKDALSFLQEHDVSNMTSRTREAINQLWMASKCVQDEFWCT